jgi:PRTRC genetic system protein E
METNFFQAIGGLQLSGNLKINIQLNTDNSMIVSVLLSNDTVGDSAKNKVPPFSLKGTAEQLDRGFFNAIAQPMQATAELFTNMENYLTELEAAKRNSQINKDKENKEKQGIEERKKKYKELMKKVEEHEEKNQFQLAISALPKADQFPEQAEDITKKLDELRKKNTQQTFF